MNTAIIYSKHENITEKVFLLKIRTITQLLASNGSVSFICCEPTNLKKNLDIAAKNNSVVFITKDTLTQNQVFFDKILAYGNFGKYKKKIIALLENDDNKFFDSVAHILCNTFGNNEKYAFDYVDVFEKSYDDVVSIINSECLFSNPHIYPIELESCIRILLVAEGDLEFIAQNLCNETLVNIRALFGDNVISNPFSDIAWTVVALLNKYELKVATAESCTAGMLSSAITSVPGSSSVFEIGISSYADRIKQAALGVSASTLKKYGAVSMQTAAEMARGIKLLSDANIGISATGVAGPASSEYKPVGTVYIALTDGKRNWVIDLNLDSNLSRDEIRRKTTYACLDLLRRYLQCLPEVLPDGTSIDAPLFLLYEQPHFKISLARPEIIVEPNIVENDEAVEEIFVENTIVEEIVVDNESKLPSSEIGFTVNENFFDEDTEEKIATPNFDITPYFRAIKDFSLSAIQKIKVLFENTGKIRKIARNTIFGLIIAAILVSSISVYAYFDASNKNKQLISSLQESWSYTGAVDDNGRLEDVTKFANINPDISAWLTIGEQTISLPVCYSKDKDFYKNHNYKKKSSKYGALYFGSDIALRDGALAYNTVIYGKTPADGSMFANINKFKSLHFLSENTQVELVTKYSRRTYQIFAAVIVNSNNLDGFDYSVPYFANKDAFNNWLNEVKIRNLYKLSEYPEIFDTITFVTDADDFDGAKLVVIGHSVNSFDEKYSLKLTVNPSPYYPAAWYEAHGSVSPFESKPTPNNAQSRPNDELIIIPGINSSTPSVPDPTPTPSNPTTSSSTNNSTSSTSSSSSSSSIDSSSSNSSGASSSSNTNTSSEENNSNDTTSENTSSGDENNSNSTPSGNEEN